MHYRLFAIFLTTFFALIFSVHAKQKGDTALIHCLAKEETYMHKLKLAGPLYQLNQTLINELTGLGDFDFISPYKEEICAAKSPSVMFIKVVLEMGEQAIKANFSVNMPEGEKAFRIAAIKRLVEETPHYFFTYVSAIQAMAPAPYCLEKEVPGLKALLNKFFYLEEELSAQELVKDKKQITNIFEALNRLDTIFKNCTPNKPVARPTK